ncbi:MAG: hypothetical protein MNPFHGCM_00025 [Gemmatimonadaceae bacterium]|nr:hypothetical protein [Gemmatimonadaceae bacterium]
MKYGRVLIAGLLTATGAVQAQRFDRGRLPMTGAPVAGGLASRLIEARRELNLTPRQLVALDSIERAEFAQRRDMAERMRARRDSLCRNRQPCELTREERQQLMGGPTAVQERIGDRLRADSVRRTQIMGMLDSTQRRLADRIDSRSRRPMRIERRVDGPTRRFMRDGGSRRDLRRSDRFRDRTGPSGIDRRMRPDDRPGGTFARPLFGPDGMASPQARRRLRSENPAPPDTLDETRP